MRDADFREQLVAIQVPLLVIAGTEDAVTTPAGAQFIVEQVTGRPWHQQLAQRIGTLEANSARRDRVFGRLMDLFADGNGGRR